MKSKSKKRKWEKNRASSFGKSFGRCLLFLLNVTLCWIFPRNGFIIILIVFFIFILYRGLVRLKYLNVVPDFDYMTDEQFADFCRFLLNKDGFTQLSKITEPVNQEVDFVAYREGVKYGILCKQYEPKIGEGAVQKIHVGIKKYGCERGIILTNRFFTVSAQKLAQSTGILLWDRRILYALIKRAYKE